MFNGRAEEAMSFYMSLFPDPEIRASLAMEKMSLRCGNSATRPILTQRTAIYVHRQRARASRRCSRRFRTTTQSNDTHPVAANVLARKFNTTASDQAWVSDIADVWTLEGWLCVILDLCSRRVIFEYTEVLYNRT